MNNIDPDKDLDEFLKFTDVAREACKEPGKVFTFYVPDLRW